MMLDIFQKKKNTVNAFKRVFNSSEGATVLKELKRLCMHDKSTYVKNDTHGTAFNEGKRAVLLQILQVLDMTDVELNELLKKYNEEI